MPAEKLGMYFTCLFGNSWKMPYLVLDEGHSVNVSLCSSNPVNLKDSSQVCPIGPNAIFPVILSLVYCSLYTIFESDSVLLQTTNVYMFCVCFGYYGCRMHLLSCLY